MGFLISEGDISEGGANKNEGSRRTSDSADGSATAVMVDDGSITLNHSVHGKIAAISGVGNLSVFEDFYSHLNGVARGTAISKNQHCDLRSAECELVHFQTH